MAGFFTQGERSKCIFKVDDWCEYFPHLSPTGPFEFLCDVAPLTVALFLPERNDKQRGALLARLIDEIVSIWQDRKVGYSCIPIPISDIQQPKPCEACAAVRKAQVVILSTEIGPTLEQTYRELALASMHALGIFSQQPEFGADVPTKKVILIGNGAPRSIPSYIQQICNYIDYAGPDGMPDLVTFRQKMQALVPPPAAKNMISITFDESALKPEAKPPEPGTDAVPIRLLEEDFELRIIESLSADGKEREAAATAEKRAPASPQDEAPNPTRVKAARIANELRRLLEREIPALAEQRFEKARNLLQEGRFVEALSDL